jgi:hypothetical protein
MNSTKLHVNVSLLPYIQTKRVADVLFELLGYKILGPDLQHNFEDIKQILIGLHVQCSYLSDEERNGTSSERRLPGEASIFGISPQAPKRRRAVIKEIRLHGDVDSFQKRDKSGKNTTYSVTKYFNEGNIRQRSI